MGVIFLSVIQKEKTVYLYSKKRAFESVQRSSTDLTISLADIYLNPQ